MSDIQKSRMNCRIILFLSVLYMSHMCNDNDNEILIDISCLIRIFTIVIIIIVSLRDLNIYVKYIVWNFFASFSVY